LHTESSPAQAIWQSVEALLERWLAERQQLLVLYCQVADETRPEVVPRWRDVNGFFQLLVDYVSAGHFEVYNQLIGEAEAYQDDSASEQATKLYQQINSSTQQALDLNDKYADEERWELAQQGFKQDISSLGESLTYRFEMEDELISLLHDSHRPS
jgi:regulator of sigma D